MSAGPEARDGCADLAIGEEEFASLVRGFDIYPHLVLAVSGGADSMALLWLMARWIRARQTAPRVIVVTVDHGLRPEAGEEARFVAAGAVRFGFEHRTLRLDAAKPRTGVQAWARAERYRALTDVAQEFARGAPVAVVTAHTEDDQAETLLMRLARGSGIDGLAAMAPERTMEAPHMTSQVMLLRPLLAVAKARLAATLETASERWVEDPSNEAVDFERVRLRQAAPMLANLGLTNAQIATSARRLQRQRVAIEAAADQFAVAAGLDSHDGIYATLDAAKFAGGAAELRIRVMARLVAALGGQAEPVRLAKIEHLVAALGSGDGMTVGGALIDRHQGLFRVFREPGREGLEVLTLQPGERKVWDRRFWVALDAAATEECQVRALGSAGYSDLRAHIAKGAELPARAGVTLASFWREERVLAVPQLGFTDAAFQQTRFNANLFLVQAVCNPLFAVKYHLQPDKAPKTNVY